MSELSRGNRRVFVLLFVIYLILVVWIVLWKVHVPFIGRDDMREVKLIPFASTAAYGPSAPREVVANLLVFVPFGVYLGALGPRLRWWRATAVVAGASVLLEVAQYATAAGSSDVTDVIANTAGGLVGFLALAAVNRRLRSRTVVVMTWALATGTVIALVAIGAVIASFPRIAQPDQGTVTIISSVAAPAR